MSSVGIMASGVGTGAVDDLLEPFDNLSVWSVLGGTPTIVAGRTGTALSVAGGTAAVRYSISAPNQSVWITVGFAFRVSTLGSVRALMSLRTDSTATSGTIQVETNGSITYRHASTAILAASAAGLVVANTWYYLEAQVLLGDSPSGAVELRRNGTLIASATGIDTLNTGTKWAYVAIGPAGSGATQLYDDLYLTMGAGAVFKGDITIP